MISKISMISKIFSLAMKPIEFSKPYKFYRVFGCSNLALFLFSHLLCGQSPAPSGFNFQAIVRDASGGLFSNKTNIKTTVSLRRSAAQGANIFWRDTAGNGSTNGYGQLNILIGELPNGAGSTNNILYPLSSPFQKFEEITFSDGYWVEVKLRHPQLNAGTEVVVADVRLQTVPYSRWAANGVPPGTIMAFGGEESKIPKGWKLCDGTACSPTGKDPVSGIPYADLFDAINYSWGKTGNNFNLPDLQGQFLRGVSKNSGEDPDAAQRTRKPGGNDGNQVGSYQGDAFQGHWHMSAYKPNLRALSPQNAAVYGYTEFNNPTFDASGIASGNAISDGSSGMPRVKLETRPKNANVHYIIKL